MQKKKVLFHKIHGRSSKILIPLALVCLVLYGVDYFNDMFGRFDSVLLFSAHLILLIFWSRMIFYKSVVSWNKLGVNIKMKGFYGKQFTFDKIRSVEITDSELMIIERYGKTSNFDIRQISMEDRERIANIFDRYCTASYFALKSGF
ncbi:hypothetical protein ACNKXS_02540 [Christiangramia marina]|uniref:hypothetical protein n=1 Tax=Christiangramia marina TaxID=409436 RepID=UPI003AA991A2